jgi:hypothetical protein
VNYLWINSKFTFNKVLQIWWIERPDLPDEEMDYANSEHTQEIFKVITDENWNKKNVNLETIWVFAFSQLYFWIWTRFWRIWWYTLLRHNWLVNLNTLKKVLALWWIERPDLPDK